MRLAVPADRWFYHALRTIGWTRDKRIRNGGWGAGNLYWLFAHRKHGNADSARQAYSQTPIAARPALPSWIDDTAGTATVQALSDSSSEEEDGDGSGGDGSGGDGSGGDGSGGDGSGGDGSGGGSGSSSSGSGGDDYSGESPMHVLAELAEEAGAEAVEATPLTEVTAMEVDPASNGAEGASEDNGDSSGGAAAASSREIMPQQHSSFLQQQPPFPVEQPPPQPLPPQQPQRQQVQQQQAQRLQQLQQQQLQHSRQVQQSTAIPSGSAATLSIADAWMRDGHAANQRGDYMGARSSFLSAFRVSDKVDAQFSAANMALKSGRVQDALAEYQTLLRRHDLEPFYREAVMNKVALATQAAPPSPVTTALPTLQPASQSQFEQQQQRFAAAVTQAVMHLPPPVQPQPQPQQVQQVQQQAQQQAQPVQSDECDVCYEGRKSVALLPCKHFCLCEGCAASFGPGRAGLAGICPICRAPIAEKLVLFR